MLPSLELKPCLQALLEIGFIIRGTRACVIKLHGQLRDQSTP